jgi:hypothetical protein
MRTGLRTEDVNVLVRTVRDARADGKGPEEAWAAAKKDSRLGGIDPKVIEAWRPEVEKKAAVGIASAPIVSAAVHEKIAILESQLIDKNKALADLGAENEKLRADLAAYKDLLDTKDPKKK